MIPTPWVNSWKIGWPNTELFNPGPIQAKQNMKSGFLTYSSDSIQSSFNSITRPCLIIESLEYIPWTGSCHLWRWWRGRQWGVNSTSTFKSGGQRILASLSIVRRGHRVGDSRCRFDRRTGRCWVTFRIRSKNHDWIMTTVRWDYFR